MDFSYIGGGTIEMHGCPPVEIDTFRYYQWEIGKVVYDKISAKKGYMEAVVIRRVFFTHDPRTGRPKQLYKDGNNWLHNEYDLCTQAEAIQIVGDFIQSKIDSIDQYLTEINC